uniref:Uncharacterized protein LOC104219219 isoform X2 n=1 Tax=Nicotiana sylvestris TaxID=4096 RepID=A0A1U7VJB6_NICSY|nr:PREDICTED: uncharacterized protein LOC104219219 isoform X2 [Nicotiana sylvestris]
MMAKGGFAQKPKKNYNVCCDYYKLKGHTREGCYKLIGYPADFKHKKKQNIIAAHNVYAGDGRKHDAKEGRQNHGNDSGAEQLLGPYFTPKQYSQILKLVKQDNTGELSANMAGPLQ